MGGKFVSKEQLSSLKKVTGHQGASQSEAGHAGQLVDVGLLASQNSLCGSVRCSVGLKDLELERVLPHKRKFPGLVNSWLYTCVTILLVGPQR